MHGKASRSASRCISAPSLPSLGSSRPNSGTASWPSSTPGARRVRRLELKRTHTKRGKRTMKHESREEHIMSDEAGAGQRPMSRRDALKAAGLAGAAALSTGAVSSAQAADETPAAVQAKNPYGGVPSGGITLPPYYRPTPYLVSNNIYYPGQEQIGPDEMRISFIGSTPIPVTHVTGRHLHHGRTGQRQAVLLRFRLRLHAQHHRDGGAVADGQRHLLHPPPRRSLRGPALPLRLRAVDGALEAAARAWAVGPHAERRHQAHDRGHEDDDPLAHGLVQRLPDGRRLRGRGQRVRFPR